jgi:hypothetical protein
MPLRGGRRFRQIHRVPVCRAQMHRPRTFLLQTGRLRTDRLPMLRKMFSMRWSICRARTPTPVKKRSSG